MVTSYLSGGNAVGLTGEISKLGSLVYWDGALIVIAAYAVCLKTSEVFGLTRTLSNCAVSSSPENGHLCSSSKTLRTRWAIILAQLQLGI